MTRQEQLFYKLEPEGCWHDWKHIKHKGINHYECACSIIEPEMFGTKLPANPDFSTWDGFGWMIEAMAKQEIFVVSTLQFDDGTWDVDIFKGERDINKPKGESKLANASGKDLPTALFEALCEYHGIEEEL